MSVGIEAVTYYLPNEAVDVADWARAIGLTEKEVAQFKENNCESTYIAHDLSPMDLALKASEMLCSLPDFPSPDEIGFVVHTFTQQNSVPAAPDSIPARIRAELGCDRALAFSVTHLGCASIVAALSLAVKLLESSEDFNYGIIVTADKILTEEYRNRNFACIQSDGGAAALLAKNSKRNRIASSEIFSVSGLSEGSDASPEIRRKKESIQYLALLKSIKRAITASGSNLADIKCLIPLNGHGAAWPLIERTLKKKPGFAFTRNIPRYGLVCCSDPLINLLDSGSLDLKNRETVLCCTISSVGAFGSFALRG